MELRRATSDGRLPAPSGHTIVSDEFPIPCTCMLPGALCDHTDLYARCSTPLKYVIRHTPVTLSLQVVKVGTSSLLRTEQNSLNLSNLARICETVRDFHQSGKDHIRFRRLATSRASEGSTPWVWRGAPAAAGTEPDQTKHY